ncbi:MAG TPA: hypothetical protein VD790_08045 [Thermoleophilaceae bacterium]|nr:hypothetical protein [Thermoleophilaceae bacterium]
MRRNVRPKHQTVVAYVALFVALGGTSMAAKDLIDGSDLKKRSVPGKKIEKNSLTGKEVNESKIGTVPSATAATTASTATSAATATSATTAANALALQGQTAGDFLVTRAVDFKDQTPDDGASNYETVLDFGGLVLKARCIDAQTPGGGIFPRTDVRASATGGSASLYRWRSTGSPAISITDTLGSSSNEELFAGGLNFGVGVLSFDATGFGSLTSGAGGEGGAKVSMTFHSFATPTFPICTFSGLAVKSP